MSRSAANTPIGPAEDYTINNNSSGDQPPQLEQSDSDGSRSLSPGGDKDGFITVPLADIRKEVQCPICLGIIRKTRTVMECLHRFCRECIDKSMRLGNNECPACRTHCASRRSLRDDPNFDALISALYPDIDKYEEEELAFHEVDRTRSKQQIQDKIAQTQRRQSEALSKKKSSARATTANGPDKVAGSADGDENDPEVNGVSLGASARLVANPRMVAWGRGGIRSNPRHSNQNAGNTRTARSNRLARLVESFQDRVEENARFSQLNIHLILVPWDEQILPSLEHPHMRCEPTVSIRHLCQYVASNTAAKADEIEILLVQQKDVLCILEGHETMEELQAMYGVSERDMHFAYRQKLPASMNSI
ncbi:E3 ubiquitin-protein ligase RING1 [Heracleum sosnowskyi]|uniref:E3 ubiquitin-protein ligase RING1 n=1 Tax=Heracleum sosnowskyi TaxID=360622 RepID=A0AAD8J126_9APIA|nr:E3 ubiquitin-protein ligase RING1 [Heracleum sosnowskyi]